MTVLRRGDRTLWRRLPVFIASTFRDMDSERDIINRIVIPSVNARLAEAGRGVTVYPVDLRWGVEADHRLDEATRERVILETCVSEVLRCRPLFLGILGTKYGELVPGSRVSELATERGVAAAEFPLSVTALEMLIAAQHGVQDGVLPVILTRRVLLADREAAVAAGAQDDLPGSSGAGFLRELVDHLRAQGCVLLDYESRWNPESECFESERFSSLAIEQLIGMVERMTGDTEAADWLQTELNAQLWAAEREVAHFVGRERELNLIQEFWSHDFLFGEFGDIGDDPNSPMWKLRHRMYNGMLTVLGDSGSGKTALLAKVALDVEIVSMVESLTGLSAPRAYCSVGVTAASTRLPVCLLILLVQFNPSAAFSIAERTTPSGIELDDVLPAWVETLSAGYAGCGPLIVFDGIDRLTGNLLEGQSTTWMTTLFEDRVRFLVSAESSSLEAEILRLRPLTGILELGNLDLDDAMALIRTRISAHHRAVPDQIVTQLVAQSRVARWLALATEVLLTLMRHDYLILMDSDVELEPQQAIRQLLIEISASLPADLDGLHAEVLERLSDLSNHWFGTLLGILDTSLSGLRGSDLFAMLGPSSPYAATMQQLGMGGSTTVDLALARDLLTGIVDVECDEWRFAHASASRAVGRIIGEASDLLQVNREQVRIGNARLLVSYLFSLPVDDPVRTRELLIQLFRLGENRVLVQMVVDPQLSTPESLGILASFLGVHGSDDDRIDGLKDLLAAAETDMEVLTVAGLLLTVMTELSLGQKREIAEHLRTAVVDRCSPGARSRTGADSSGLLALIDVLVQDPLNSDSGSLPGMQQDWLRSVGEGTAGLRDMPRFARGSKVEDLLALQAELWGITCYAYLVAAETVPTPRTDDAQVAAARLDYWRGFDLDLQVPDRNVDELIDLTFAVACRAARALWPATVADGAVESDFERSAHLSDRLRGNPDAVILLSRCVRTRMTEFLVVIRGKDELEESDAKLGYRVLQQMDEALWHLNIHCVLEPDSPIVGLERLNLLLEKSSLLSLFDQDASSCRVGLEACTYSQMAAVFGFSRYIELAVAYLSNWYANLVDVDPTPVLKSVFDLVNGQGTDPLPGEPGTVEVGLLMTALHVARRFGPSELADSVIDWFLARCRVGAIPAPEGLLEEGQDLRQLMRAFLEELEDELLEALEEAQKKISGPDHAETIEAVLQITRWMYTLRTRLSTAHRDDLLGAALAASLHFALSGAADWRMRGLEPLGTLGTFTERSERETRVLAIVHALHTSSLDRVDWASFR
ncbi:DUF4062 domain-containing protein [Nocardia cyriacigeorgica]|uniref:DUF4062 domain-containing protein n=1 Tax=Nocardia cyriacigeorgica TaxID=135487 RepID=UPI0018946BF2|nr:DUF4062 domain-containing protein [Nocardia cyriacigeorgica]MBF6435498.1 DUF4062 domain-containing protein [Nocardia cyriacigeorgica]MBF6454423.1 DUF4062 domain-containing protein [Nocardia cyriacigeorgica]MBF6478089.1 DUF4062 domain-containing protein [Nocardia cyriacigeorgica]MBF6552317.1 DUF4062 domain-containing protein [Nocardia cyriacigeorgica]